jgi:phospholipase/lecithinase/hemolysin
VPNPPKWAGSNTLFTIWVGINDIGATFGKGSASTATINQQLISEYTLLVEQLYATGARNFVFVTVPTIDRSPGTIARGAAVAEQEKIDVVQWNQLLVKMAQSEKTLRTDTNIWIYDANALFSQILNNVKSFPQTAGITNTTDFCAAYAK